MAEKDWAAILKDEDRIIANSDRRFRYHCYSLESMSEELTYQERSIYIEDDFTEQLMMEDFIDTVRNEKLAYGLRRLTDRQRFTIELAFWEGYQYKEIVSVQGDCSHLWLLTGSGHTSASKGLSPAPQLLSEISESKGSILVMLSLPLPIPFKKFVRPLN